MTICCAGNRFFTRQREARPAPQLVVLLLAVYARYPAALALRELVAGEALLGSSRLGFRALADFPLELYQ